MKKVFTALLSSFVLISTGIAAPGDVLRVNAEKVNLRANASDESQVLTTITPADELIELRRDGAWIGVRVLTTGDEGWVYDELAEQLAKSRLQDSIETLAVDALAADFARLVQQMENLIGYPITAHLTQAEVSQLRLAPSRDWWRKAGFEAHLALAMVFYYAWKDHHQGRAVELVLLDEQKDSYITIRDEPDGPVLELSSS